MEPCQGSDCLNGGRRVGGERRGYAYAVHIPERRSGEDRRSGKDRRRYPRLIPERIAAVGLERADAMQPVAAIKA